jgi:formylglycine-generating enzyme required for sulfatase activity
MIRLDDTTRHELITLLAPIFAREDRRRELLALALGADSPALRQITGSEWQSPVEAFVLRLVDALARADETGPPALAKLLDFARERVADGCRARVAALAAMIPATTSTAASATSATATPLHLRVFLASPGDVSEERGLARQVLEQIPYDPLLRGQLTIETVAWDQPGGGTPMLATMTPQAAIAAGLPRPAQCDIVVVIVWSRMGTPLPADPYRKPDGSTYVSGTEWEYLDALAAAERCGRPQILVYRRTGKCLLDPDDADFDDRLGQRRRVEAFFATFRNPDGSIRGGVNEYAAPAAFGRDLGLHLRSLIAGLLRRRPQPAASPAPAAPAGPAAAPLPLWTGSPFPGLRAFTPADAPIFFGRGRETDQLVRRLADGGRFIAIVGASGSGKSSLVAAGLLPRLADNAIEGSQGWLLPQVQPAGAADRRQWSGLRFTPGELGDNPFLALAARLAPLLPEPITPRELAAKLAGDPASVAADATAILATQPDWAEMLVFIDQFEELLTVVAESQRAPFVELLAAAAATPRLRLLVTMRADFYPRWLAWPRLPEALCAEQLPVVAPGLAALFQMITAPAARAGLDLDEGLAARILEETGSDAGALALLAFALHELYEARNEAGRLTHAAYDGFGGVRGAISRRAEKTFQALPAAAQALLQPVFGELVEVDERGVATRRRLPRSRLASGKDAERLLDAFIDARLLVSSQGAAGAVIEVAHEALFREWPRLRDWIGERADDLRTLRQAEAAAAEWQRSGGATSHLWPHERLQPVLEALARLGKDRADLAEPACSFLRPEAERLLAEIAQPATSHYRRAEIGDRLASIGDARPGVGMLADGAPDIDWCEIPAGTVELEDGRGEFRVERFFIARYPLTWQQYQAFVADPQGYADHQHWWQGLQREASPGEQFRPIGNCPAENVSWYDAIAYCRWASARLGHEVRLPTEAEWQQAALGGQRGNEYPWGYWREGCANTSESRLGRTTAVGMYPAGASAQGVLDLAGNVWEWCLSEHADPRQTALRADARRVVRGGSWNLDRDLARCAYRGDGDPGNRNGDLGLRLVCVSPILKR